MTRRLPRLLIALLLALSWSAPYAYAQQVRLRRPKPPAEGFNDAVDPKKPTAEAKKTVNDALVVAGVNADSAAWSRLAENYSRLDAEAQAEPGAYKGDFPAAAFFTHGYKHLWDIISLARQNEGFAKDLWAGQGMPEAQRDQAYKDLLLAIVGHDSQQNQFADARPEKRKEARDNHAFEGGLATARAYLADPGSNPEGNIRALVVGFAAAGHSKSAVKLRDQAQCEGVVAQMATKLSIEITAAQKTAIVNEGRPIAAMLGALDALRGRADGPAFRTPCGVDVEYRLKTDGVGLEVYNKKEDKVLETFSGADHRSYVEYQTHVTDLQFNNTNPKDPKFQLSVEFQDPQVPDTTPDAKKWSREKQVEDIANDVARCGYRCEVTYQKQEGGTKTMSFPPP
jgi:hypothetical protein